MTVCNSAIQSASISKTLKMSEPAEIDKYTAGPTGGVAKALGVSQAYMPIN